MIINGHVDGPWPQTQSPEEQLSLPIKQGDDEPFDAAERKRADLIAQLKADDVILETETDVRYVYTLECPTSRSEIVAIEFESETSHFEITCSLDADKAKQLIQFLKGLLK